MDFFEKLPTKLILYPLNEKGSSTEKIISEVTETIEIPTTKSLFHTSKDVKNWTSNVLHIPISSTLESGDAFFNRGTKNQKEIVHTSVNCWEKACFDQSEGVIEYCQVFL